MRKIQILAVLLMIATQLMAQDKAVPAPLELEYVMELNVTLGQAYSVGSTTHGSRNTVPITGGKFEGPKIKGEIPAFRPCNRTHRCGGHLQPAHRRRSEHSYTQPRNDSDGQGRKRPSELLLPLCSYIRGSKRQQICVAQ